MERSIGFPRKALMIGWIRRWKINNLPSKAFGCVHGIVWKKEVTEAMENVSEAQDIRTKLARFQENKDTITASFVGMVAIVMNSMERNG